MTHYAVVIVSLTTWPETLCVVREAAAALRAMDALSRAAPEVRIVLYVMDDTGSAAVLRVNDGRWYVVVPPAPPRPCDAVEPATPGRPEPAGEPRELAFSGGR